MTASRVLGYVLLGAVGLVLAVIILGRVWTAADGPVGGRSVHPDERRDRVLSYTREQLRNQCREQRRGSGLEQCLKEVEAIR